jgi:signal transduction histidine kinase/ActR/RegA family two-component response regulator
VDDQRVLIYPPSRRDGEVTRQLLEREGLKCRVCFTSAALAEEISGGAGAVVLTDAALNTPHFDQVLTELARQPPWSDLPLVLLCEMGPQSQVAARIIQSLTNVTLLDRPTSARTLLSAAQAALRARLRQYETRQQLEALRKAEEAFRDVEDKLRAADRRKDEFLAMLAHELRNPLAPIRNASELLSRTLPAEPRMQTSVAIVKRQLAHLSRLVDDLLDVSRITQGRIELQRQPLELSQVITQAMESVEPLIREKRHKVFVASGYGPLYVNGDSARLVQCISNILTNSAKYTDDGGQIRVDVHEEHEWAVIEITDNGVGIPRELLPQIFDLFVQSARSLDRSQGGLGIGLSVVQRLIEMHGGSVSAHSDGPGHGARFEVRLPRTEAPHDKNQREKAPKGPARRILIVDDNEDAANSLALLLRFEGHTVESVYTPEDAIDSARSFAPQIILLDIGLPGMDGYEVARRVRAAGNTARLVALTGYGQAEDVERALAAGVNSHLVKPVDLQVLRRKISQSGLHTSGSQSSGSQPPGD